MTTTTSSTSTAITVTEPVFTNHERLALAGFLAGYTGLTREAYALDLRQYASWCQQRHLRLFQARRADIESLPATWRPAAGPGPPSPAACAPSPDSTSTPWKKNFLITPQRFMSAARAWIMSRMPPGWTATSSARCWSRPGLAWRPSMR